MAIDVAMTANGRARTVLVERLTVRSSSLPTREAASKAIVTLEGPGTPERPDPIQEGHIPGHAVPCGYCANGMTA